MSETPRVLLGVTGGIAAYKAADLVRRIADLGADVHCVLTENAARFVTPLTFQVLSRNPVHVDAFQPAREWNVKHISLAEQTSLVVLCPATANIMAKLACGIADDFLSTVVMAAASACPVLICPAMNPRMWDNPIVRENKRRLISLGYEFVDPEEGPMACEDWGRGRLASPETILRRIKQRLA